MINLCEAALSYGFSNEPVGTHGSRTIMLAELRLLLAACPDTSRRADYRAAIIDDNVLLKRTVTTRRESFRRLRELYALSAETALFRILRELWPVDPPAQPLLALLCAAARDPILRATAGVILATPVGALVTPQAIAASAGEQFAGRYHTTMLANIGRHAASSWQQSGHLAGRLNKIRVRAESRPVAVAYALLLGYLCGARGGVLFQTFWARLLDAPAHELREQAIAAAQRGWLEYRHAGDVTEVGFHHLLRNTG